MRNSLNAIQQNKSFVIPILKQHGAKKIIWNISFKKMVCMGLHGS
jgi:hypothetical protein